MTVQGGLQECWRGTQNLSSSRISGSERTDLYRSRETCRSARAVSGADSPQSLLNLSNILVGAQGAGRLAGVLGQCPGLARFDLNLSSELTFQGDLQERWGSADITCEIYNILMNFNRKRNKLKIYAALAHRDLRSNGSDQTGRGSLQEC